jgi:hypothetical protein
MKANGRWALNILDFLTRQATCVVFDTSKLFRDEQKELPANLKMISDSMYEVQTLKFATKVHLDKV